MELDGLDAPTPGGSALDDEEEEEEPVELDEDDLDPINSGAVTPAVVVKKSSQFTKRKETKVSAVAWGLQAPGRELTCSFKADDQGSDVHHHRRRDYARGRRSRGGQD